MKSSGANEPQVIPDNQRKKMSTIKLRSAPNWRRLVELPSSFWLFVMLILSAGPGFTQHACGQATSSETVSRQVLEIWPGLAPGEESRKTGTKLSPRNENELVNRIKDITVPTLTVVSPQKPNGTALVILPGGGFRYVVTDKEGTRPGEFFAKLGITSFVLSYRVSGDKSDNAWKKPAQDSQRAIRWIRKNATQFQIDPQKIGLLGFSAGGQTAAAHMTATTSLYEALDDVDGQSFAANFCMLVYPWRIEGDDRKLKPMIRVTENSPPTFIVSTHDDKGAVSTGAARLYIALKENGVESELHIFGSGGHGYGIGKKKDSVIHKWTNLATDWLSLRGLATVKKTIKHSKATKKNEQESKHEQ